MLWVKICHKGRKAVSSVAIYNVTHQQEATRNNTINLKYTKTHVKHLSCTAAAVTR